MLGRQEHSAEVVTEDTSPQHRAEHTLHPQRHSQPPCTCLVGSFLFSFPAAKEAGLEPIPAGEGPSWWSCFMMKRGPSCMVQGSDHTAQESDRSAHHIKIQVEEELCVS